ncbi:hypothetical protein QBC40DRAFT_298915 [Triangularia verruculosa]|uniref:Uncharacterized protein n=1 Tax=Triangularia verruculosa TaxID=2587418 RepID=A0AAN6XBY5_9PEZI|nr:hypothetical protein QBC40DRAFT_298915 [Triangularia verruculosa]
MGCRGQRCGGQYGIIGDEKVGEEKRQWFWQEEEKQTWKAVGLCPRPTAKKVGKPGQGGHLANAKNAAPSGARPMRTTHKAPFNFTSRCSKSCERGLGLCMQAWSDSRSDSVFFLIQVQVAAHISVDPILFDPPTITTMPSRQTNHHFQAIDGQISGYTDQAHRPNTDSATGSGPLDMFQHQNPLHDATSYGRLLASNADQKTRTGIYIRKAQETIPIQIRYLRTSSCHEGSPDDLAPHLSCLPPGPPGVTVWQAYPHRVVQPKRGPIGEFQLRTPGESVINRYWAALQAFGLVVQGLRTKFCTRAKTGTSLNWWVMDKVM